MYRSWENGIEQQHFPLLNILTLRKLIQGSEGHLNLEISKD